MPLPSSTSWNPTSRFCHSPARLLLRDELLPCGESTTISKLQRAGSFATQGLDGLKALTGLRLQAVLAPSEAIQREMIERLGVGRRYHRHARRRGRPAGRRWERHWRQQSATKRRGRVDHPFVNQVLKDAIELRASDVHLEPSRMNMRIRYRRIDGVLQEVPVPAQIKRFQPAIVARGLRFSAISTSPRNAAAGRSHQSTHRGCRGRHPRINYSDAARRGGGHALMRQNPSCGARVISG